MMNKNLLIVGAGIYGLAASEIAADMGCFDKIDFIDDQKETTENNIDVIGTTRDIEELAVKYNNIVVAVENAEARLSITKRITEETPCRIISLISPKAYISPTAQIMRGCIIEPMAVIHSGCVIAECCIISSGAVVNYTSMCCEGVHVDCNAVVSAATVVSAGTKVECGVIYSRKTVETKDFFLNTEAD